MSSTLIPTKELFHETALVSNERLLTVPPKEYSPWNLTFLNFESLIPDKTIDPLLRLNVKLLISIF